MRPPKTPYTRTVCAPGIYLLLSPCPFHRIHPALLVWHQLLQQSRDRETHLHTPMKRLDLVDVVLSRVEGQCLIRTYPLAIEDVEEGLLLRCAGVVLAAAGEVCN
jgi:hypothetical protein